ncbi:MAG TPA: ABC transporter substrate-binding protein [Longimicrobiales bacterium]|nr:ABC transporter substrate-binding protein [Longimicrobiales bacterium]
MRNRPRRCVRPELPLFILLGIVGFGCGGVDDPRAARESTLVVHAMFSDEWLFGPAQADEAMYLVFLPLARQGPTGEIEGQLIRSWERSDDYRHWIIHLRTDVRWHDGVPVTAHDVAFTADLLMHPDVARIPAGAFSVTVLDDSTYAVEIVTRDHRAVTPMDRTLRGMPLPKHLLENLDPAGYYEWEFWLHPVGNGPYRYARHTPRTMVQLEANPDFYLGPPPIERVVLKFSGDNQLAELTSGNVDVALYVEWADLLKLADDPRFRSYWTKDTWVFMGILWNVREGPLSDPRVRRALTMAIDRQELYGVLNLPEDTPLIESVFTERQYWRGELPEPVPYDPGAAGRLLEDAGWTAGPDGTLVRDGEPLAFTALVLLEDAIIQTAAIYVQDQLRDFGARMELVPLEFGVLRQRQNAGDFDAVIGEVPTASEPLARQFGRDSYLGYRNERARELIARAGRTVDPEEIDEIYRELGAILRDDLPMTALFPDYEMHVAHRRVRGLSSPWRAVALRHMEDVWLEDEP